MVTLMAIDSPEMLEALLKEVLEVQKDLGHFLRSKSDNPLVIALAAHMACNVVLDEHEDGSDVLEGFADMAPRADAIVDLGHNAVLKSLEDGSYGRVFAVSVEIGAAEHADDVRASDDDYEVDVDDLDLN